LPNCGVDAYAHDDFREEGGEEEAGYFLEMARVGAEEFAVLIRVRK